MNGKMVNIMGVRMKENIKKNMKEKERKGESMEKENGGSLQVNTTTV